MIWIAPAFSILVVYSVVITFLAWVFKGEGDHSYELWRMAEALLQKSTDHVAEIQRQLILSGVSQTGTLAEQVKALHNTSKFWEELYRKEKSKNEGGRA